MFSDSSSEDYALLDHDNIFLTRTKMRAESEACCLDHWERMVHAVHSVSWRQLPQTAVYFSYTQSQMVISQTDGLLK